MAKNVEMHSPSRWRRSRASRVVLWLILSLGVYLLAIVTFWTVFRPSWLPNDLERETYYQDSVSVARAEVRGIGLLPVNGWLGFHFDRVVVDIGADGSQFVLTNFLDDGTCSFTERCADGRVVRQGRFHPLKGLLPMPQSSEMVEGTTFDSSGNVIGELKAGTGTIDYEACGGERYRVTFKDGFVLKSTPVANAE